VVLAHFTKEVVFLGLREVWVSYLDSKSTLFEVINNFIEERGNKFICMSLKLFITSNNVDLESK